MSRVGKQPIPIPDGIKVTVSGRTVTVTKDDKSLSVCVVPEMAVEVDQGAKQVTVTRPSDSRQHRSLHGLTRSLINNMVVGLTKGYEKKLEIYGAGYGCNLQGNKLMLNCGYMGRGLNAPAQFEIPVPDGVEVQVDVPAARGNDVPARLTIRGTDKQKVHQFAADLRRIRPPEPYKGKGIRYADEYVKRLPGKAFVGGGS
ncbi:MAG: 50S ribosomal protein L6 [Phycisphaerae bacterium]|nr:50S ribosomal protein L6 [Phycisphaerae bacterium]